MTGEPQPLPPRPLPPRGPHPLAMHVAVDSAVAFLAILVLGLIWSLSIGVIIAIALLTGIGLAPWTHRTEVRQLADRRRTDDDALDPGEDATT